MKIINKTLKIDNHDYSDGHSGYRDGDGCGNGFVVYGYKNGDGKGCGYYYGMRRHDGDGFGCGDYDGSGGGCNDGDGIISDF